MGFSKEIYKTCRLLKDKKNDETKTFKNRSTKYIEYEP